MSKSVARGEVILRKNEDRRLLAGHKWVFSNEILKRGGESENPILVDVRSFGGHHLGTGIYNANSLIAVRLLEGRVGDLTEYLEDRISEAVRKRSFIFPMAGMSASRLVHSEADGLPGLVVDRYGEYLSVQITTRAFEEVSDTVLDILSSTIHPKGIRVDRRLKAREIEGLATGEDLFLGEVPLQIEAMVGGSSLVFPFRDGQKTGLFLDQKDNIDRLAPVLNRERVLDAFCYVGAWSVAALRQDNVRTVTGVDSSARAMNCYTKNTKEGGKESIPVCDDFFDWSRRAVEEGRKYDAVILDPPAFIKSRRLVKEGIEGYFSAFRLGTALLENRGILVACSCSALLSWEDFSGVLRSVFKKEKKRARIIYQGHAAWDHPRILSMPELDYLKCAAFHVETL